MFVGRLVPEKGVHLLIEAFKALPPELDLQLALTGPVWYETEYQKQLETLIDGDERIHFVGQADDELLAELYSNCRCFVLPSDVEGMSLSLLDALAYGCPIVTSSIPPNTSLVQDAAEVFEAGRRRRPDREAGGRRRRRRPLGGAAPPGEGAFEALRMGRGGNAVGAAVRRTRRNPPVMTTLLNINNYHYRRGGAEVVYLEQSRLFREAGWDVAEYAMHHPSNLESEWSQYFVDEVDAVGDTSVIDKVVGAGRVVYSTQARRNLKRLLDDVEVDIAHAHNVYHHLSPAILPVLHRRGIPTLLTTHDLKLACPRVQDARSRRCLRTMQGRAPPQRGPAALHQGLDGDERARFRRIEHSPSPQDIHPSRRRVRVAEPFLHREVRRMGVRQRAVPVRPQLHRRITVRARRTRRRRVRVRRASRPREGVGHDDQRRGASRCAGVVDRHRPRRGSASSVG